MSLILGIRKAFKKMRENKKLSSEECKELENFLDRFITCLLNPAKLDKMCQDGKALAKLALEVQQHHHTKTCRKYETSCRFRKPTFPMKETTVIGNENKDGNCEDINGKANPELLSKVKELLDDADTIKSIMSCFNKEEESEDEYIENRNRRIDMLLEKVGATYIEYLEAIKHSTSNGYSILLARDIDEGYINAFNPEWLEAWNGNIDLQPTFDFFGVITYVTDYLTKDDQGVTAILREVQKQNVKEDTKNQM